MSAHQSMAQLPSISAPYLGDAAVQITAQSLLENSHPDENARSCLWSLMCFRSVNKTTRRMFVDSELSTKLMCCLVSIKSPERVLKYLIGMNAIWGPSILKDTFEVNTLMVMNGVPIIHVIEEMGYDLNSQGSVLKWTPLICAVFMLRCDVVMYLVDRGVDLEPRDKDGLTAKDHALRRKKHFKDNKILLEFCTITSDLLDRSNIEVRDVVNTRTAANVCWGIQ